MTRVHGLSEGYRICVRCVMDTSHQEIEFDAEGVCNFCRGYERFHANHSIPHREMEETLHRRLEEIRHAGAGREYDCLLGVSGGVDSSYLALKCHDWKLRPLLVQFDNGWNTELANHNIEAICRKLDLQLVTYVVDWPEFRDLQLAFLKAGVANLEAPSDHGISACIYRTALERGVRWVLTGVNFATESYLPLGPRARHRFSYGYRFDDLRHLRSIHRRFGSRPLRTFPQMGFFRKRWLERSGRVARFDPLNYLPYNKSAAIRELQERVAWRPYPGKHFESVITRFHQSYILPMKFGVDKRRLHLSGLIWSGQLTRELAVEELKTPGCPPELLTKDREFFLKKLGLTPSAFDAILKTPPRDYSEYPNLNWLYLLIGDVSRWRLMVLERFRTHRDPLAQRRVATP